MAVIIIIASIINNISINHIIIAMLVKEVGFGEHTNTGVWC